MRIECKGKDLHTAIDEAWNARHLVASCPVPGTYLIHAPGQRPVEGVAVWRYSAGTWACEADGAQPCLHIQLAKQEHDDVTS